MDRRDVLCWLSAGAAAGCFDLSPRRNGSRGPAEAGRRPPGCPH